MRNEKHRQSGREGCVGIFCRFADPARTLNSKSTTTYIRSFITEQFGETFDSVVQNSVEQDASLAVVRASSG